MNPEARHTKVIASRSTSQRRFQGRKRCKVTIQIEENKNLARREHAEAAKRMRSYYSVNTGRDSDYEVP